jgi:hypothetical protein
MRQTAWDETLAALEDDPHEEVREVGRWGRQGIAPRLEETRRRQREFDLDGFLLGRVGERRTNRKSRRDAGAPRDFYAACTNPKYPGLVKPGNTSARWGLSNLFSISSAWTVRKSVVTARSPGP